MAFQQASTVPDTIEYVFKLEYARLINGEVDVFSISAHWKSVIGQQGVKVIAKKLGRAMYAEIRIVNKEDRIFMEATPIKDDNGIEELEADQTPVDDVKAPRPPNAFILYRQYHHESIKAKYPGYRNTALSQIIGAKWKSETPQVRKRFVDMARDIKEEHSKTFPGYSYKPRKSADKKRRMTITKAAQVETLAQALVSKNNSVNNNFSPMLTKPKPALIEGKVGNHATASFVFGDPNVTAKELHNLIRTNNEKFPALPVNSPLRNAPAILGGAPAPVLEDDFISHEALSPWKPYNSGHAVDGGQWDEEFESIFAMINHDNGNNNPGFGGDTESVRQPTIRL